MRNCTCLVILATVALSGCTNGLLNNRWNSPRLVHAVYFKLTDDSEAACAKLIEDCYKYLSKNPGIVFFTAGEPVESHKRDVNVRDWHVSLHIVFKTKDYHDSYQNAPGHHKFLELNKDNFSSVRVFDSFVK